MNEYEARRAAKAERYRQYAENAGKRSDAALDRSHQMLEAIPLGQPILIGHHSEKRDRNYRDRAWNLIGKGVEEGKKAEYWARRAAAVEDDTSISSRDPDAVPKLQAKIAELEERHAQMVRFNKDARKAKTDTLPSYVLSNSNANIRRYKQRLEQVQKQQASPTPTLRALWNVKRAGTCAACKTTIERGGQAYYDRVAYEIVCMNDECRRAYIEATASGE